MPRFIRMAMLLVICSTGELASWADGPARSKAPPLAFRFSLPDDEGDEDTIKLPYFRLFDGGKDKAGQDASSTLKTLKLARGESRLYPQEDVKPGLIVVLRRIVLMPLPNGDYKAILEGEFNAVQTRLPKATMDQLLAGEVTDLKFESETTKGIRPLAFKVKASTRLRGELRDGSLVFYGGEGSTSITHYGLTGTFTFDSESESLGPDDNTKPVYIGKPMKPVIKGNGAPETLPLLN